MLGYCDVVWDKKTIDVKEEMAGSFSVTIRCSFVGGDHQWVVTELYAKYALRDHLWDELEDVAGLEVWLFIPFRQGFFR